MNAQKTTGLLAALGAVFFFAACSDISSDGSSDNGGTSSDAAAYSDGAYIKVVDSSQTLRTALPHYAMSNFDTFVLYSKKASEDETVRPSSDYSDSSSGWTRINPKGQLFYTYDDITTGIVPITPGTYWFMLVAIESGSPDNLYHPNWFPGLESTFVGITDKPVVIKEGLNPLSFTLTPKEYSTVGNGHFSVKVTLPSVVKAVKGSLYKYAETTTSSSGSASNNTDGVDGTAVLAEKLLPISGGTATYEGISILAGIYVARFELYLDEDATNYLDKWDEFVIIANDKRSTSTVEIPDLKVPLLKRIKDKPDSVGDIVLTDGRAISFDKSIAASDITAFFNTAGNEGKDDDLYAIGVVFYTGYSSTTPTGNEKALGDRILVVSRLSSENELAWATEDAVGHTTLIDSLSVTDKPTSLHKLVYEYGGTKYAGALDGCKLSIDELTDSKTKSDKNGNSFVNATYPAFRYVYGSSTTTDLMTLVRNGKNLTGYFEKYPKNYFYLPSVAELIELRKNLATVNAALATMSGLATKTGCTKTLDKGRYWSCSQYAAADVQAWSVGFLDDDAVDIAQHSNKKETFGVLGILEYSSAN